NGDRVNAIRAIQLGAFDYPSKPTEVDCLRGVLERAAYLRALEADAEHHREAQEMGVRFEDILGTIPAMRQIFGLVVRVARTDATVLLQGESGTGKELLARAIHSNSPRKSRPFVAINCGAIPETLLESELFGHEKGAYTGAHVQRQGRVETASGGTLFLDEIGELPASLQVKILRFLQEQYIERVGGRTKIQVDTRVIAATNVDLKKAMSENKFREDLFYRLAVVTIRLPSLRERSSDVPLLAKAFLRKFAVQNGRAVEDFNPKSLRALQQHFWPGNVRELEIRIKRAVIMAESRYVTAVD